VAAWRGLPGRARGHARPLLDGAIPWLLAQQLGASSAGLYPSWIALTERQPAWLAWCYGDVGIASAHCSRHAAQARRLKTAAFAWRGAAARTFETSAQDAMSPRRRGRGASLQPDVPGHRGVWLVQARRWFAQVFQRSIPGPASPDTRATST
jgi:hypothetical protein